MGCRSVLILSVLVSRLIGKMHKMAANHIIVHKFDCKINMLINLSNWEKTISFFIDVVLISVQVNVTFVKIIKSDDAIQFA